MSKTIQKYLSYFKSNTSRYCTLVLVLWATASKISRWTNVASTIHVKQSNLKASNSIHVSKKVTPGETTQNRQIARWGNAWTNKAYCRARRSASSQSQAPPLQNTPIPPHLVTQILCKSPSYSAMKGVIPPSSSAVAACTSDPSPGQATQSPTMDTLKK